MKNVASNTQEESANTQGATAGPSIIRPRYALVANKIDQEHLRVIKSERHHKFAQVINILLFRTWVFNLNYV